jgi:hypothetical protein
MLLNNTVDARHRPRSKCPFAAQSCRFLWVSANVPLPNPQQPFAAGNGALGPRSFGNRIRIPQTNEIPVSTTNYATVLFITTGE